MTNSIYDFTVKTIRGDNFELSTLQGKVILIVNTASQCGFTCQYAELEQLYQKYHAAGLEILAFPCNQFLKQEPGDSEQIEQFCDLNYGISFPIMAKIKVNGPHTEPLYKYLKSQARGVLWSTWIKWNFTKFLISRDGKTIVRYGPQLKPLQFEIGIKSLINEVIRK